MLRSIAVLCSFPLLVFAQRHKLNDSLSGLLRKDSLHIFRKTLAKPYLKIDNRNSFVLDQAIDFYGGMVGATFLDRHTLAVGYYFLDKKSRRKIHVGRVGSSNELLNFGYLNFAYQYVVVTRRYFQVQVPVEIGIGRADAKQRDSGSVINAEPLTGRFIPYSGGVQAIGKITSWLGVSLTGGYRYIVDEVFQVKFSGFYYSYGVWIDARHLFRKYRYHKARNRYRDIQESAKAK